MTVLLLGGVVALAAGILLALPRATVPAALPAQLAGVALLAAGAVVVLVRGEEVGTAFGNGVGPSFGLDGLSAWFLVVVCAAALPALLAARDALRDAAGGRVLAALTGGFVLALAGVLGARDALTFLAFWELMTLVPAAAILVARRDAVVRRVVFVYLAVTHLGGAGVWIAVLALARAGAIGHPGVAPHAQALIAAAALVGFGTKAGLIPLHAWLPRAHPVAPAHVSALMSGVMVKVALYGLVRVLFSWLGPVPQWVALTLLAAGLLSALGGVLYAIVQRELKRLLAFSTIENAGIVALALAASLLLRHAGEPLWASVAFAAALLHVANHAAFKTLLFLGAGAFAGAVGRLDLDHLGGLLRRMPWTGWPFLVGCAAIAGAPVLNGFTSEWLTLQSLLHVAVAGSPGVVIAGALATAGLGATAALALFCFVKVAGLVLLGEPRTPQAAAAQDPPVATRAALVLLAGACLALALAPGLLLPTLAGLAPGSLAPSAHAAVRLPGTGSLPPVGLLIALVVLTGLVARLTAGGGRAAPTPVWACGQLVQAPLRWTSAGFTKPLRLVLESVLRPQRDMEVRGAGGVVQEVSYRNEVPHLFDTLLYRPAYLVAVRGAELARRLQSGSLSLYLAYLTVLVLLALALIRIGALS